MKRPACGHLEKERVSIVKADMKKIGIRYPLRESGPGGCVGKGSGPEEMETLEVLDLKWEF
jgi:hypothetical protein